MTSRGRSRTDKPLASIDNILNSAHIPVYKRLKKSSIRKKSMPLDAKLHLYDFELDGNNENCKKFKKSQKVRKRARIQIRHNKENSHKTGKIDFNDFKINRNIPINSYARKPNENGFVKKSGGFGPVENQNLSVASEPSDGEQDFLGFSEQPISDRVEGFIKTYASDSSDLPLKCVTNPKSAVNLIQLVKSSPNPYFTPNPYLTSNPYMTPDPYKTPAKSQRNSYIPIIEFDGSAEGNQLQTNCSSQNINPNDTFHNVSYGVADRYYSTPFKQNSFNASSLSDLSSDDFNVTNCFGFENSENIHEEFLVSPIKIEHRRPVQPKPEFNMAPSRPQLPPVQDVIDLLKDEKNDESTKPTPIFSTETDISAIKPKNIPNFNDSSLSYISQELCSATQEEEPKIHSGKSAKKENKEKCVTLKPVSIYQPWVELV